MQATCFQDLDFPPGHGWRYSNTGYMLTKKILEMTSGRSFSDLIAEHVTGPLYLTSAVRSRLTAATLCGGLSRATAPCSALPVTQKMCAEDITRGGVRPVS